MAQKIKKVKNSDFSDIFWIHGYRQNSSFFETQAFRTSSIHFLDQNLTLITNLASEFSKISQKLEKNRCFRLKTAVLTQKCKNHFFSRKRAPVTPKSNTGFVNGKF